MEIDLARALRAVSHIGSALDEIRSAFQPGPAGVIRVHTEDKIVELPLGLITVGLLAAVVVAGTHRRREQTTEPTSLSWQHAMEHPPA
jgi:hypothetical protein